MPELLLPQSIIVLLWRAAHAFSDLPLLVPLAALTAGAGAVHWRWARLSEEHRVSAGGLMLLVFGAADGLLMLALPWLGLSYGPVGLPWLMIILFRTALTFGITLFWPRVWRGRPARPLSLVLALNLTVLALEVYGFYFEPFNLTVTQRTVTLPAQSFSAPVRIVQLSDLHIERLTPREKRMLEIVLQLNPDMIVLTGDYLNLSYLEDDAARRAARALLAQLHAPYGVYAVEGTVDSTGAMPALFDGLDNITVLSDEIAPVRVQGQTLYLVGVANRSWGRDDGAVVRDLMQQIPAGAPSILLYHTPDAIEAAAEAGVDLYLAGHTHGGQIRLPGYGAMITFSRYGKRYEMGAYRVGATEMYVSRGIGMEGMGAPRVRFLCAPEIVDIELKGY